MNLLILTSKFKDYSFLKTKLDHLTKKTRKLVVHCRNCDKLAHQWCFEKMLNYKVYHYEDEYNSMTEESNAAVVFGMDKEIRTILKKMGKKRVIKYDSRTIQKTSTQEASGHNRSS